MMIAEIGWIHPVDVSDQWDGFNDSGVEHFAGNPIQNLAREIHQNALDATDGGIVDVRIRLRQVKVSEIPNIEEFNRNIKCCLEAASNESTKAEAFFKEAARILQRDTIAVLEISDFNTKGMVGPSENGTPFYAFMKAKGQSKKEQGTASGSFGIGKFAPYAVSKLRTVFISTVYDDASDNRVQLTQGKSILMSHDLDGKRRQGVGFWGITDRCQPVISDQDRLPQWLQRAKRPEDETPPRGSTLSILGFDAVNNWETHLAVSVAENFFAAISDGKLRVSIGDKFVLDQRTIYELFEDEAVRNLSNQPDHFLTYKAFLEAYSGGVGVVSEESEQQKLGRCEVRILVREGLPKKVCILRNGMFITDSMKGLKRFSDFKDFVAVICCHSTKGNELLRRMEPPRHDDFEPDRLFTKEDKVAGKKSLDDLANWIKSGLKKHAKDPVSEVTSIDELSELFGDDGDNDSGKANQEVNPYGSVVIRAKPIKIPAVTKYDYPVESEVTSEGGEAGTDADEGGGGGDSRADRGDATGGKGNSDGAGISRGSDGATGFNPKIMIDINNVRAITTGPTTRRISFTPTVTGKLVLRVKEAGADSDYPVSIGSASQGQLVEDGLILDTTVGSRVSLEVTLNQSVDGALRVIAHEI